MTLEQYKKAEEAREIEAFKQRLASKHKLPRDAKFDKAWKIAWDYGHDHGFSEVALYFADLAKLLKP